MSDGAEEIKNRLLSVWNRIKFGQTAWLLDAGGTSSSSSPVWLLGQRYSHSESFAHDFVSKLWLTYRREFQEFRGTRINSDCGWGCTIRSGQMLLGNALLLLHLGRRWRWKQQRSNGVESRSEESMHRDIIRLFGDQEEAPLSIHSLLDIARMNQNRSPGEWFGPSSTSHLLRSAVSDAGSHRILKNLRVYIANDCTIYNQDILNMCVVTNAPSPWIPLLILIPLRLGGERLNPIYVTCIKSLLATDECVGIIGGRPKHSLYFIGFQDNYLIHLDPHLVQDRVDIHQQHFDLKTFHCSTPKKMSVYKMDPSCCFGFLIKSKRHFEEWKLLVKRLAVPEGLSYPMFTILEGKAADRISHLEDLLSRSISLDSNPDEEFVNVPRPASRDAQSISEDFVLI